MRKYFDLNRRITKAWKNNGFPSFVVNGSPETFSETGDHLSWESAVVEVKAHELPLTNQLFMYLGTFVGVLLSTAVNHFISGDVELSMTLGEIVVSAVIALVIIPLVYEKLMLNPKAPFIVQFGLFVQNGVFWHVLIDSLGKVMVG